MTTAAHWYAVAERAVKSAAQTLVLLWTADQGFNVLSVDVDEAFGLAGGAGVLSMLTSIASSGFGRSGPSLTTESVGPPG